MMEKTYDPKNIERKWYQTWEKNDYFQPTHHGKPFCIMLPPPNVTGSLHMGHGFQQTIMDILTRYHRMCGDNTLWQPGTDHAGISTQMVVERQLLKDDITRHDIGRENFIDKVWQWKQQSGNHICQQMRRMGASVDWTSEKFTMDDDLSKAVITQFIRLYDEGLIYRGKRLVNWDPTLLTAISDLEVISEEEDGNLWYIQYSVIDSDESLTIATTRPETLFGDTAIAVNPDDPRYQHLIGKKARLPLVGRDIPIIADYYVDMTFGTGSLKVTPAHDFNDHEIGQRHQLPLINIMTPDARLNDNVPQAYRGLDRFAARKQIIEELTHANLLVKTEPHRHKVPRGDRSQVVIEPFLTDQWFMKMTPLAEPAIQAVKDGTIQFVPNNWSKTYFQWLHNIEDWCISRQLWWGHRIPAWYDEHGNIYVGENEKQIREKYQLSQDVALRQDNDVLDTWFSSALWPFSTLGWPEKTSKLATFYPTNVLVTGFDIIFFWVARMIMMGLKFTKQVPFHTVYIHGLIRDADGQKMSKTKGNVLDPIDLIDGVTLQTLIEKRTAGLMQPDMADRIEKNTRSEFPQGIAACGTDALRFTYCALAATGRNIRFDLQRLAGYRNFCNKLWNASRYVLMNTEGYDCGYSGKQQLQLSLADEWISSRLQQCIEICHQHLKTYRFDLLAHQLYDFIWNEFCDWYLELSKPILASTENPASLCGTRHTLLQVLDQILRLLHPIMPFITEEIWQKIAGITHATDKSLMLTAYPTVIAEKRNIDVEKQITWGQQLIIGIRNIRSEMHISPGKPLDIILHNGNQHDRQYLNALQTFLTTLAKLNTITWHNDDTPLPAAASYLVGEMEVLIPLADIIDKEAENQRLIRELAKLEKELQRSINKLNNENFIKKAPGNVVNNEKNRVEEMQSAIKKIHQQLQRLCKI